MMPTCTRCGLTDARVIRSENGVQRHVTPMKCIAALKRVVSAYQSQSVSITRGGAIALAGASEADAGVIARRFG